MTPFYLSELSIEGEYDQTRLSQFPTTDHASSFPFPDLFNKPQEDQSQQLQPEPIDFMLIDSTKEKNSQGSGKWMSSKMRIMRKMMIDSSHTVAAATSKNLDQRGQLNQDISSRSSSNDNTIGGGIIRVCSDCNTTKTPLWRSGPRGPKSLCNACGIRQRKARRAIATAAGGSVATEKSNKKRSKETGADVDHTVPFKKRCRMINTGTSGAAKKKLRFDDFKIRLSKNSALHPMFPQDERDAAILLMALSCGLIRS